MAFTLGWDSKAQADNQPGFYFFNFFFPCGCISETLRGHHVQQKGTKLVSRLEKSASG